MSINAKQKQHLKALAHALKPVVIIGGKGLTSAVLDEIEIALAHHELIKIKIGAAERDERQQMADEIATSLKADIVQIIGRVGIFFRPSDKKKIQLP